MLIDLKRFNAGNLMLEPDIVPETV